MAANYRVGHGKPPKNTRFKKGRSGNPKGRPKGTKNLKTDLQEELDERITIREPSGERRVSKQRALVKSLTAKAIKGDTRAANVLLNMILKILEIEPERLDDHQMTADEQAILETLEKRLKKRTSRSTARSVAGTKRQRLRIREKV